MTLQGNPLFIRPQDTAIWQSCETLNDLFADANNLEETCQLALNFILTTLGRESGALLVQRTGESAPLYTCTQKTPPGWQAASQPEIVLPLTIQETVSDEPDHVFTGRLSARPEEPVCAFSLEHPSGIQGTLFLFGGDCNPEEAGLLSLLGRTTARAIYIWRTHPLQRSYAGQLEALQTLAVELGSGGDLEKLHEQIILGLCRLLDAESGALVLPEQYPGGPIVHKIWLSGSLRTHVHHTKPGGLVQLSMERKSVIRCGKPSGEPAFASEWDAPLEMKVRSSMTAPLTIQSGNYGVVQVFNKRSGTFSEYEQELLSTMARLSAQSLQAVLLIRKLQVANADLEASHWELLHSRSTLRVLFDSIPASIYIIDAGYRLVALNRSRAQQTGKPSEDLLGRVCYAELYQRDTPCTSCRVRETLTSGTTTNRASRMRDAGDELVEWEITTYPIAGDDAKVLQAVILEQDVTEKRRLENILAQSEKLAAVGQLAAGIAHEINNPLTAIIANAQLLQRDLSEDSDLRESVDLIARAGARATQVVRNLLDFARRDQFEPQHIDVNENIRQALALVQHELRAREIILEFQPGERLPLVLASRDHLLGVWLNLLVNAIDAIEREGLIRVTTFVEAGQLRVTIADNGKGIAPEKLLRIFEPFYTTKASGRGTGLGLTVCQRIIKQHGGTIEVESVPGMGSQFSVSLPI